MWFSTLVMVVLMRSTVWCRGRLRVSERGAAAKMLSGATVAAPAANQRTKPSTPARTTRAMEARLAASRSLNHGWRAAISASAREVISADAAARRFAMSERAGSAGIQSSWSASGTGAPSLAGSLGQDRTPRPALGLRA